MNDRTGIHSTSGSPPDRSINEPGSIWIYGAGGHGVVVAETALAAGWNVPGFIDDNDDIRLAIDRPVFTPRNVPDPRPRVIVGIGDNGVRRAVCERIVDQRQDPPREPGIPDLMTVIHPTAWVSPSAEIGNGVFVGPHVVVHSRAMIHDGVILNSGAIVEHDCVIECYSHIAPSATLGADIRVGEGCLIGLGASVRPGVRIGNGSTAGVGAVVVKDVPSGVTVVGVPAKVMSQTN